MNKLKLAYFGTPDFSARLLEKILVDKTLPVEVVLVVSQPDRPVGRKQILTPSPVKIIALKYGIKVIESITHASRFMIHEKIDLALLYAYGEIIPQELLHAPRLGFWNIHPSLLPKYRGASPIAYPLLLGDIETGVTLMQMDEELDHGPIIAQEKYTIQTYDKRSDLEIKLTDLGFELFKKTITLNLPVISIRQSAERDLAEISPHVVRRNDAKAHPQDHPLATYTRRLTKQDGFIPHDVLKKALNNDPITIEELPTLLQPPRFDKLEKDQTSGVELDLTNSSKIIYNYFRGISPWPGLWTLVHSPTPEVEEEQSDGKTSGVENMKRLKITEVELIDEKLIIKKIQLEGKKEVSFAQFAQQYKIDL